MDWPKFISIGKDLIIAGAAITGSIVAAKGLSTWRRQLKGQAEYELSKRILKLTFQYRDTVCGVRNPVMWSYEMPQPPQAEEMDRDQLKYYGTSKAYEVRCDRVTDVRQTRYPELLEAEALWGIELEKLFETLFNLQNILFTNIGYHLSLLDPNTPKTHKASINKLIKEDVIFDTLHEEDNFRKEFSLGVKAIEQFLKPHLKY